MRQPKHLITPAEALRRIFLPSANGASRTYTTHPIPNRSTPRPQCLLSHPRPRPLPLRSQQHPRNVSTSKPTLHFRPFTKPRPTSTPTPPFGPKDSPPPRHPRDEEISASKVQMVLPAPTSQLSAPLPLTTVLSSRARDEKGRFTQFVQEVASARSPQRPYPVCKMMDKKAAREAEEAQRKAARANKATGPAGQKRVEVSWGVSDYDLGHRMVRLKGFLEKGCRVEVVFGSRRRGWMGRREVGGEEAERVLGKIRRAVGEVEGAWERGMQGEVGKEAVLSFEGKARR